MQLQEKEMTIMIQLKEDNNFRKYLEKNYHRIVNYEYYQGEGIPIGSGAVESSVKQIAAVQQYPVFVYPYFYSP